MCGIVGFLDKRGFRPKEAERVLRGMMGVIAHRGPDGEGIWLKAGLGIALGHRRLSIIDLSAGGEQPMTSANGRWTICFNGEIYNFNLIRAKLEQDGIAFGWRSHSDTEVLLEAISAWGIDRALTETVGMFAFALWDAAACQLTLARDRVGEKPLYYGSSGSVFLFGSELKALRRHPSFDPTVSSRAVASYLRHGYVPAPHSIYASTRKLEPGCYLQVGPGLCEAMITRWWHLPAASEAEERDAGAIEARLETALTEAVGLQMNADVPMGAFLSGGVDSSLIVALMQKQASHRVKTFSIGFDEEGYDESHHAKAVARHLDTDHRMLRVNSNDALDVVPLLSQIYDEPFADSSQIPTYLLARLTKNHVTCALSGDGGDELFGGYRRYIQTQSYRKLLKALPYAVRNIAGTALGRLPAGLLSSIHERLGIAALNPDFIRKISGVLSSRDTAALYNFLISQWHDPRELIDAEEFAEPSGRHRQAMQGMNPVRAMMAADLETYLPNDILVKVDRASMAASLEARVPMLDHRVIEIAARIPLHFNVRHGAGKHMLRSILYRHVPRELIERPKQGFAVPIDQWLRGPLREWAEELLRPDILAANMLEPQMIRAAWHQHLDLRRNLQHPLWTVLMLQAWSEHWKTDR
jgi:asparagine synthase (glutamine-hydrolysing)